MFSRFYDPDRVGQLYAPNVSMAVEMGRSAGLAASSIDRTRTLLLLIDMQVDFVHSDGALSVPGAVEDARRTIEWLLRHTPLITTVAASLDSHVPLQIFSQAWWVDETGRHPAPFTVITSEDAISGRWLPLYEPEWSLDYVRKLEQQAKKALMIWPYHTLVGTVGHSLTPALYEAIAYHASARQSQPVFLGKGSIPKTEHYSIIEPEVKVPEQPLGGVNAEFLDLIASYQRIYIAGQAKSHCVLETIASLIRHFEEQPEVIRRLHLLTDCTSSVAHPEINFDAMAEEALARFSQRGLQLVTSTDALL
jgi:nicotinamidase/pyrazinamidase